jgi:TolB-like protein
VQEKLSHYSTNRPSLVLPCENLSGDREQEYFANGMVEEIITALSRMRELFVIGAIPVLRTRVDLWT